MPLMWKADISSAFRRLPIRTDHHQYATCVFRAMGANWASVQLTCNFGAVSSVWAWHRASNFILAVLRQVFKIASAKYVDDFFGIQREGLAMKITLVVELMCAAFGFPADPAKSECLQQAMVVLGAKVTINWMRLAVNLCVAPEKLERWVEVMDEALVTGTMTPGTVEKMLGRLTWSSILLANKVGRAFLKPFHAQIRAPMRGARISTWLRRSLVWFKVFLRKQHLFEKKLCDLQRRHVVGWSDATGVSGKVSAMIYSNNRWLHTVWQTPLAVTRQFMDRKDEYIAFKEMLGVVLMLHTFREELQGTNVSAYIDNNVSLHALINGYCDDAAADLNAMAGFTWLDIIEFDVTFFAARVETHANPADDASRDDLGIVTTLQAEWKELVLPTLVFDIWREADSLFPE